MHNYNPLNRQQRRTLTLNLTQMLEALSCDGMTSTLPIMGAVTSNLDTHTPPPPRCHYRVRILRWYNYNTRLCSGVMDTCDYRSELMYVPTALVQVFPAQQNVMKST